MHPGWMHNNNTKQPATQQGQGYNVHACTASGVTVSDAVPRGPSIMTL